MRNLLTLALIIQLSMQYVVYDIYEGRQIEVGMWVRSEIAIECDNRDATAR